MKLETQRLILRKPKKSDWKDLVEGLNNMNVAKTLMKVKNPYRKKDAEDWIKTCIKEWNKKEKEFYPFMIELKSENKVIGQIDLRINMHNKIGNTASWINEEYWRKGYITEAKIAVNDLAFNKLKLRKLETDAYLINKASNATQKRVGYKSEGLRRKHSVCIATGKIHDEYLYGLLKPEWKKVRPKLIKHLKEKIKQLK